MDQAGDVCYHIIFGFCRIFSASKLKCFSSFNVVFNKYLYSSIRFITFCTVLCCELEF